MPLAAVLPLMLLICVLVDRFRSFNFCAMAHEMRLTCEPGSHKHLTSKVLPLSSDIRATMVASNANELASASHSVMLLLLATDVFVKGWLVAAVHNNPLCFTLHLVQARNCASGNFGTATSVLLDLVDRLSLVHGIECNCTNGAR